MTRDEAIKVAGNVRLFDSEQFVDALIALGMLKLDEPKSANQKARDQARNEGLSGHTMEICLGAIERAGLRIVEK
jgi:hypothetical protein